MLGKRFRGGLTSAPPGSRVYAIGDIHGRLDLLMDLHEQILDDAAQHPTRRRVLVHLGDYVDRGPDSARVLDLLLDRPLPGFEIVNLLGNHEDSMVRFRDDPSVGPAWLYYGGLATLAAYGIEARTYPWRDEGELQRLQTLLRQRLPARHLAFIQGLSLHHTEGDYLFVHAGIRPGIALKRQEREDLLWIRDEFLLSRRDHGKVVVHGHTIKEEPDIQPNRIGIDTGAFATGRLTCLVLEGSDRAFLST
jgi:serine/threonine protein phosphatase 1